MMNVSDLLKGMTDDEKIGQLFMIGIKGGECDPDAIDMVKNYGVGGIILFARNITGGDQVKKLITDLKSHSKHPLAVSIDQEGGLVLRLTAGATVMPGNMAIAACPESSRGEVCETWGRIEGEELRNLGFTLNLAPVLDINSNPQNPGIGARSFSDQPELCAEAGFDLISAVQRNGVSACAKHFPGKGNAAVDAHLDLPVINASIDELRKFELVPFKKAIEAGVDAVMTAHVVFPGIPGETLPGTLSKRLLTDLLKVELGFGGPVITDDMEMGAIAKYYPQDEACFQSFMAGGDIILICHTKELQLKAIELFKKKLASGELPRPRLDDACRRILGMKARFENYPAAKATAAVNFENNAKDSLAISERSITLVSEGNGALAAIKKGDFKKLCVFEPKFSAITQVEDVEERSPLFSMLAEEYKNADVTHTIFSVKIEDSEVERIVREAEGDIAVIVTYNGHLFRKQIALANKLIEKFPKSVVAAVRNPYDLALVDPRACRIATYGFRKNNMATLFKVLASRLSPAGKLPVSFEKVSV
ncbi:MAG TPA: beta-N-acetylhexosaminidase [Candidatus Wallbacteria bacterium]|nr:beta-N-acetylhexosaminidase [Candidatus Wallbacteria bacterium]